MNLSLAHLLYDKPSKDLREKDYYSGGMVMPERSFSYDNYGFGFNGKLKDDKVKGDGNSYDFGERIYDPRLGKWLSIDPMFKLFPNESPYIYTADNPLIYIDKNGDTKWLVLNIINEQTRERTEIRIVISDELKPQKRFVMGGTEWSSEGGVSYYDWNDINIVYNITLKEDGTSEISNPQLQQGEYRTWTFFKSGLQARLQIPQKENDVEAGDIFVSNHGGGYDSQFNKSAKKIGKITDLDGLLAVISVGKSGSSIAPPKGFVKTLEYLQKSLKVGEKLGDFAEQNKQGDLEDPGTPEPIESDSSFCEFCDKNISSKDTSKHFMRIEKP